MEELVMTENVLSLTVKQFFTEERARSAGVEGRVNSRLVNCLINEFGNGQNPKFSFPTMYLITQKRKRDILNIPNLGELGLQAIERMLAAENLKLADDYPAAK